MARMEIAGVKEIASLVDFGVTQTRKILARSSKEGLLPTFDDGSEEMNKKNLLWVIRRSGSQYVH